MGLLKKSFKYAKRVEWEYSKILYLNHSKDLRRNISRDIKTLFSKFCKDSRVFAISFDKDEHFIQLSVGKFFKAQYGIMGSTGSTVFNTIYDFWKIVAMENCAMSFH